MDNSIVSRGYKVASPPQVLRWIAVRAWSSLAAGGARSSVLSVVEASAFCGLVLPIRPGQGRKARSPSSARMGAWQLTRTRASPSFSMK